VLYFPIVFLPLRLLFKLQRGNSRDLSQPLIAKIHSLKEAKMEEKNQQDRLLGGDRELGDDPEGRVKFEGASQEYEFSSEDTVEASQFIPLSGGWT
jgi:hypothetical protein